MSMETEMRALFMQAVPKPYTRPGEVFLGYVNLDAGVCVYHGVALASGMFCWDHRVTDPAYCARPVWELGEDRFTCARHLDGTPCTLRMGTVNETILVNCHSQARCPECRQYNTLTVDQGSYGDTTTCRTPGCDYHNYHSIGD